MEEPSIAIELVMGGVLALVTGVIGYVVMFVNKLHDKVNELDKHVHTMKEFVQLIIDKKI